MNSLQRALLTAGLLMVGGAAILVFLWTFSSDAPRQPTPVPPEAPASLHERLAVEFGEAYPKDAPPSTGLREYRVEAALSEVSVAGRPLKVWAYNGQVPGPVLRVRLGETLRVTLLNKLPMATTIHWHGVRVPIEMDGVPGISQPPVKPGQSFVYEYVPKDAGTYWFHPHVRSAEQVERGLYGVLIVEDAEPLPYSQDVLWMLDDWRLDKSGQIDPRFVTRGDLMHDGRWGNVVTVNGKARETLEVRVGERIRLRMVNTANGRVFKPDFLGLDAQGIAVDGLFAAHPFDPVDHDLAPGNRLDVELTISEDLRGQSIQITDRFGRQPRVLGTVEVLDQPSVQTPDFPSPAQTRVPGWREGLGATADLTYVLDSRRGGKYGIEWTMNDKAFPKHESGDLGLGRWSKIRFVNESFRLHPMHVHGMFFKVLSRNGEPVDEPFFRDTALMRRKETMEIGLIPFDKGEWMLHCHILEHAAAGMMTTVRVGVPGKAGQAP